MSDPSQNQPNQLESELNQVLKDAMRAKDMRTADCVRMLKTKHMERRTAAGFKDALDDKLWVDVIAAYQKQLKKSREEFEKAGERGKESIVQIDFEVAFCARFLPAPAGEDEVRAVVKDTLARLGVKDPKAGGKAMGEIMKVHKGVFDPQMVKRLVDEELSKPAS